MLYTAIIAVCSEIRTNYINTLCGQYVELLDVKLEVHIVTTGQQRVNLLRCDLAIPSPPPPTTSSDAKQPHSTDTKI